MNIAQFFATIGIKGGKKSAKEVDAVGGSMKNLKKMSLEAKIAITAALYAVKRIGEQALNTGQQLQQFNRLTGISTDTIQRYESAGRKLGLTVEEVRSAFIGLQKAGAGLDIKGTGLDSMLQISRELQRHTGEIIDVEKIKKDQEYAVQIFQRFARLDPSLFKTGHGYINELLSGVGLSDNFIQALKANAFNMTALNSARVLSAKEIGNLASTQRTINESMEELEKTIATLVSDLTPVLKDFIKLMTPLLKDLIVVTGELVKAIAGDGYFKNAVKNLSTTYSEEEGGGLRRAVNIIGAVGGIEDLWGSERANAQAHLSLSRLGVKEIRPGFYGTDEAQKQFELQRKMEVQRQYDFNWKDSLGVLGKAFETKPSNTFHFNIKSTDPQEGAKEIQKVLNSTMGNLSTKQVN